MKPMTPRLSLRTAFWGGAALAIAAGLFWAFRPQPILVDTARAQRGEMIVAVQDEGRARVRDIYILTAPVSGHLVRVERDPGDPVEPGDIVARLLPPASGFLDARAQEQAAARIRAARAAVAAAENRIARARADHDLAASETGRIETLAGQGVAAPAALDRARRDLRSAEAALAATRADHDMQRAELEAAQAMLAAPGADADGGETVDLLAPIAGRILRLRQESETVVAAGAPVLEIGDPEDLEVVAEFVSAQAAAIRPGARAMIGGWGGEPDPLAGQVRRVEPSGFTKVSALGVEEQRVNVIIDLDDPVAAAGAGLGDGWRVEVAIVTAQAPDVLQIPVSSLFRSDGGWAVFAIDGDRARQRAVQVGLENGEGAEILTGLAEGDTVILYPGEQIAEGARVRRRE